MLKHAAELMDGAKRRLEATVVVADLVAVAFLVDVRELTPDGARRMRHHRPRPCVLPCIPGFIPGVNAFEPEVGAAFRHEERRDGQDATSSNAFVAALNVNR